ncbi:hypothetical protein F0562_007641 [Nyssa sinensis]|uniref:Uncharacterized protein n=1 Tax=Nyssa sinensis TaxID=561372 RepID=A0A5J5A7C1_9ASTE|nr:hypothetical protein F0562_007641 [Nyssa sinensis]
MGVGGYKFGDGGEAGAADLIVVVRGGGDGGACWDEREDGVERDGGRDGGAVGGDGGGSDEGMMVWVDGGDVGCYDFGGDGGDVLVVMAATRSPVG